MIERAKKPVDWRSELLNFVNESSAEVRSAKESLDALLTAGLITDNLQTVTVNGEDLPFLQHYGRLEGQESRLNAVAAFTIRLFDESDGRLDTSEISET